MAGKNNVSSLIPSDINNNLFKSNSPKSFGDQTINKEKQKLVQSSLGKVESLKSEISLLTQKIIDLEVNHANNLNDLSLKVSPPPPQKPTLTLEEYQLAVNNENSNYQEEKALLQEEKALLQQRLEDLILDPYKKIKNTKLKLKLRLNLKRKRNKDKSNKEKKRLSFKVLKSQVKSLYPIIALQGTKILFNIVTSNKKIQDLIDDTNAIIEAATTREAIENARVIRTSTLAIINDNERKLNSLAKLITTLNRIITVLNIVLRIIITLFTIPKPFGLGPTMPTPVANRVKKIQDLISALNVILSILQGILQTKLEDLRDLKDQLKNINDILDNATLDNLSDSELQDFINLLREQSNNINNLEFPEYKGFKFKIKEEESTGTQQAIVVRGTVRRRYAVAINKDGIEVLKSELSFTLDPPDLIEQLKIVIDQQNLQA